MLGLYLRNQPEDRQDKGVINATDFVRDPNRRNGLGLQCAQFSEDPVTLLRKLNGVAKQGAEIPSNTILTGASFPRGT